MKTVVNGWEIERTEDCIFLRQTLDSKAHQRLMRFGESMPSDEQWDSFWDGYARQVDAEMRKVLAAEEMR